MRGIDMGMFRELEANGRGRCDEILTKTLDPLFVCALAGVAESFCQKKAVRERDIVCSAWTCGWHYGSLLTRLAADSRSACRGARCAAWLSARLTRTKQSDFFMMTEQWNQSKILSVLSRISTAVKESQHPDVLMTTQPREVARDVDHTRGTKETRPPNSKRKMRYCSGHDNIIR